MIQYTKQYKKSWQREMKIGDWVWLNNYTKRSGLSPKLQIKWELVPYKISQFLSEVVVEIHQHGTNKKRVVHINKLKRVGDQERWNEKITPKKPIIVEECLRSGSTPKAFHSQYHDAKGVNFNG